MTGAFWFLPMLRIGPIPTRAVPWFTRLPGHGSADYDFFRELKLTEIVCSPRIAGPSNCNLYLVASIGELPISTTYFSMKLFAHLRWVPWLLPPANRIGASLNLSTYSSMIDRN
jgi:hypothetical protein